jgi:hypothetical protein
MITIFRAISFTEDKVAGAVTKDSVWDEIDECVSYPPHFPREDVLGGMITLFRAIPFTVDKVTDAVTEDSVWDQTRFGTK